MSTVPAGWYADPSGQPDLQRWWDGTAWTDHVHPAAPTTPVAGVAVATLEPAVAVDEPQPTDTVPAVDEGTVEAAHAAVPGTTWPVAGRPAGDPGAGTPPRGGVDPLAVVALVAGLVWLVGLGAVAAIVCGALALRRGVTGTSRTLAIVGLVLGVLGLLPLALLALGVGAVAVPAFLGQVDAASRAQLESDLRNAAIEQETYFTGAGTYLADAAELQTVVAPGTVLSIVRADEVSFCLEATDGAHVVSYDSTAAGVREGPC